MDSFDYEHVIADLLVTRNLGGGRREARRFCLDRARHMDKVLPAVSGFTVSIVGQGQKGRENKVVHGPKLDCGRYMRVVLRPGPGTAWTCVSAFPITEFSYWEAMRSRRAKFPP